MPQVRMVLIQAGGRTKAIPLPPGIELGGLVVKAATDDDALHDLAVVRPVSASTLAGLQAAVDQRSRTSAANAVRAREAASEKREAEEAEVALFVARLSRDQGELFQRLCKALGFLRPTREGGGYRTTTVDWLRRVKEVCPDPAGLDWMFLRFWLAAPTSVLNTTEFEGQRQPEGRMFGIRRSVALKKFAAAWSEQRGPLTSPPVEASRIDLASNHPFSILREGMVTGRIGSKEQFFRSLTEYREAGVISPAEYEEAHREFTSGRWFGFAIPFRVV